MTTERYILGAIALLVAIFLGGVTGFFTGQDSDGVTTVTHYQLQPNVNQPTQPLQVQQLQPSLPPHTVTVIYDPTGTAGVTTNTNYVTTLPDCPTVPLKSYPTPCINAH